MSYASLFDDAAANAYLGRLTELADQFRRESHYLDRALATAAGTSAVRGVQVSVSGGQMTNVSFDDRSAGLSASVLSASLKTAFDQAMAASAAQQAQAVSRLPGGDQLAAGMRAALPAEVAEVEVDPADLVSPSPAPSDSARDDPIEPRSVIEDGVVDDGVVDDGVVDAGVVDDGRSLDDFIADLRREYPVKGDPSRWQADFEAEVQAMAERARSVDLAGVEGRAESRLVQVTAGPGGVLKRITFRPPFRSVSADELATDVLQVYADAVAEAAAALTTGLTEAGLAADDDLTGRFGGFEAR